MRVILLAVGIVAAVTVPARAAQQTVAPADAQTAPQPDPQIAECAQAQPVVSANLEAALERLDEARQTNSAVAFRAAADDLQAALLDVRARLAPCATMQPAGGDAHAGHVMPGAQGAPAPPEAPAGGAAAPARPAPQPAPVAGAGAAAGAHTGHVMATAPQGQLVADPRCQENVNPASSPQASHEGRTYYFCSESDRQRFVADPARYLETVAAPAQSAPAHAH
jgi:YHS domain-containing protein